jgi:hypothetical protein
MVHRPGQKGVPVAKRCDGWLIEEPAAKGRFSAASQPKHSGHLGPILLM